MCTHGRPEARGSSGPTLSVVVGQRDKASKGAPEEKSDSSSAVGLRREDTRDASGDMPACCTAHHGEEPRRRGGGGELAAPTQGSDGRDRHKEREGSPRTR
jgi:hypothetical protein